MKKSIRKTCRYLSRYIGQEIIRIVPARYEDGSTDLYYVKYPVLLIGFTPKGEMKIRYTGIMAKVYGNEEYILPLSFIDRNWVTYKKACKAKNNELNKWKGKKIKRVRPVGRVDRTYMDEHVTLISTSKHHMVVMVQGKKVLLDSRWIKPEDWILVEE